MSTWPALGEGLGLGQFELLPAHKSLTASVLACLAYTCRLVAERVEPLLVETVQ
ncbi:hypothetical protein OOK60_11200 [Trichothermofontia sichuanensis B231]|uniref:hypothetical protein n=1 Tax=Trichothermofontia sichuanensis TaxID=3045816 RepID=UPI0022471BF6|nr:hypothetical protein [Trichothermofontia sichuanensis]UZQ53085.1 hypothetical protein OOK60_11200 [Trichothermofontia sichuanensis B231]